MSETALGHFRTAPNRPRDVTFVWSGAVAGQCQGIDRARGGMRPYGAMLNHAPDFFLHSGDAIYADGPLRPEVALKDGTIWKNVMTEDKSKVAETLHEFRHTFIHTMLNKTCVTSARQF